MGESRATRRAESELYNQRWISYFITHPKFKMIHWGTDQILQPQRSFKMGTDGLIAKLVRNDAARHAQLIDQIRTYRDTMFSREIQQTKLRPMIDRMEALLVGFGVPDVVSQIATVRQQLRLAASAGYLCAGLPDTNAVYVLKDDISECLHASNTEGIPAGAPHPLDFEVYHRPLPDDNDKTDLWYFNDLGNGKSITSQAYDRVLHASNTLVTDQGTSTSTPGRQPTTTMPKSSRSSLLTHRTSSPSAAISHSPASAPALIIHGGCRLGSGSGLGDLHLRF